MTLFKHSLRVNGLRCKKILVGIIYLDKIIYKKAILENDYVVKTDLEGNITFVNDNFCTISGFSREELLSLNYKQLVKLDQLNKQVNRKMLKTIFLGRNWQGIIANRTRDNDYFYLDTSIHPLKNDQDQITEILSFGNNVTDHIKLLKYDKLTGLKNRESLRLEIKKDKHYAIVIANLDNFSEVNEFYGGYTGDMVIKESAKRLSELFTNDCVFRLQSDEFAVLIPLPYKYDKAIYVNSLKNRLKSLFDESCVIDGIDHYISATFGLHIGNDNLLRNANIAYKNSKKINENFSVYADDMFYKFADFSHNKKVAFEIKDAIAQNQITPYYQAIIDNKTGKIEKYEALARIVKEEDIMMPGTFLNISKKIKYYNDITRAMILKCFDNFKDMGDKQVSINLTIEDISNIRTFNFIIEQLSHNKNNKFITFELVETEGIDDFELFDKFVKTIKKFGANISIDDFGTGYSNFSYLTKMEPDFLKIDGSLIKNIENQKDFDVVKSIVDFAKMYDIKTIAEFVENEDIYVLVKELGIDYSQGYHFGRPVPFEEIEI